jgi:glycosyltransferase involved in cell wall biosynthesis
MSRTGLRSRLRSAYDRGCLALVRIVPEPILSYVWHNPLFDRQFYLTTYADVARARVNPERHYRRHGIREGRNPNPFFRTSWYLRTYPDVAASTINPLDHYYFHGGYESRDPSPLFRSAWYRSQNVDVRDAGINPLLHYMRHGLRERRLPSPGGSRLGLADPRAQSNPRSSVGARLRDRVDRMAIGHDPLSHLPRDRPAVLVMEIAYARPDRDSGSLLAFNLIRLFQRFGYHVAYLPVTGGSESADGDPLRAIGVTVLRGGSAHSIPTLLERISDHLDVVMLSRVDSAGTYVDDVRRHCVRAKVLFNTVDLHWLRLEREAMLKHDRIAMYRAMEVRERELYVTRLADATLVVSTSEKPLLESLVPGANVVWCPLMHDVPGRVNGYEHRSGLAFMGGYLHRPNVDAVKYFLDEIWPEIRTAAPDACFYAIGMNMPESLTTRTDPGFVPVGRVPDVSTLLAQVRLTVAPLRFGAGAKGKVIASLAHGVPCIITPIAAEGMALTGDELAIASDPKSFAAAAVEVYSDPDRWLSLSARGIDWVKRTHSLEVGARQLATALKTMRAPINVTEGTPEAAAPSPVTASTAGP